MNGREGGRNISCPPLVRFVLSRVVQRGVAPVLDKPLNKRSTRVGGRGRVVTAPVRLPLLVDGFLQPPPVPPVLSANFVSTGIAVFLAGHDSSAPVKPCNSTIMNVT